MLAWKLLAAFGAGSSGALVNSLAVWICGLVGLTPLLGARITPALTVAWVSPRLFYGGLWALLLLLPGLPKDPLRRAALVSLAPTLYQLFKVFPQAGAGMAGLHLGPGTPLAVVVFNLVWAVVAQRILAGQGVSR